MPRRLLEALAEAAWSMWAWPALEGAGEWPVALFGLLCCLAGLALGAAGAWGWAAELRAALGPASPAPAGALRLAGWAAGRVVGVGAAALLALAGGWGLICLARVAAISL